MKRSSCGARDLRQLSLVDQTDAKDVLVLLSSFILPLHPCLQRHADGLEDFMQYSFSFFAASHR